MKKSNSVILVPAAMMLITSCGGGSSVGSKDDAAKAAYGVLRTGEDVNSRSASGLRPTQLPGDVLPGDGVSVEDTRTVSGKEGKATIISKADVSTGSVQASYSVKYESFTLDGVNYLDGELTYTAKVTTDSTSAAVTTEMKGQVNLTGEVEAQLDTDIVMSVNAGPSGASVSFNGKVTADGQAYDFTDEAIDFETGDTYFSY